jgi:transposase
MFGLATPARVFLANDPVDMRKQYGGLWSLAENKLKENPFGGALFVFTNKSRDRVKMLYRDGSGAWVFAKRPEKGRFSWPLGGDGAKVSVTPAALTMLLAGIELKDGCKKAWYER